MKKDIRTFFIIAFSVMPILFFAQNVGIGTTLPTEKLDIAGNLRVDTLKPDAVLFAPNAGAGKILTSDDTGNATWENLVIPLPENNNGNVGYGVWGDCATNGNISEYEPVADTGGVIWDQFGFCVSTYGDFAIAGANGYIGIGTAHQGYVNVYQFSGNEWVFLEKLIDASGDVEDQFGYSVCVSGNYAIVGSILGDGPAGVNIGAAIIYQFNGSNWVLMEKITDADGGVGDRFGLSVAISGDYAIIGADLDDGASGSNQGSASIYHFDGNNWILMEKITDTNGAVGDAFGHSVAISGDYAVVGAYMDDGVQGANQGSLSIYHFDGSNWIFMQKLFENGAGAGYLFGSSVSIRENYLLVGAPKGSDKGGAYIYHYDGSSWVYVQRLNNTDAANGDLFGCSVFLSGNYAIVGAESDDVPVGNEGSASIFIRVGYTWQRLQHLLDPSRSEADHFGTSVSIDGSTKRFIIGVPNFAFARGKSVFGKVN